MSMTFFVCHQLHTHGNNLEITSDKFKRDVISTNENYIQNEASEYILPRIPCLITKHLKSTTVQMALNYVHS